MIKDPIRIILVDDQKFVLDFWKRLLENNPQFTVIAQCGNAGSAIEQAQRLVPDIMLVDMNMHPVNGLKITEKLLAIMPSVKIIGLSVNNQPGYAIRLLELGGRGYFTKTSSIEEITYGIIEVYKGHNYICNEVVRNMPPSQ
jgi:DNA-binding NarL/FixJ family response regulator